MIKVAVFTCSCLSGCADMIPNLGH